MTIARSPVEFCKNLNLIYLVEEEEQAFVDEIIADFDQITASKRFVRGKIGDLTGKFETLIL